MIVGAVLPAANQPGARDVSAVEAMLEARFESSIPFLLLPVRIETRFVQAEVTIDRPVLPADLLARLREIREALDEIAGRQLATDVAGKGVTLRRRVKDVEERDHYAFVETQLKAAGTSAVRLGADAPSCYQGDSADLKSLERAIASLPAALEGAAANIARLRSVWNRGRLSQALTALSRGPITVAIRALEQHTLPALRLFVEGGPELRRVLGARDGARAVAGKTVDRLALARSARLSDSALDLLRDATRRLDDRGREADARVDARALTDVANRVAAMAGEVIALPAARRETLATDGARIAARARHLANTVDSQARLGSSDAEHTATLAEELRGAAGRLENAIGRLPIEDVSLAGIVAKPPTRVVHQLRVRVFPDDLFVQTHETELTAEEIESGKAFWRETLAAGTDEALKRAAWRALVRKHGAQRAAWIARRLEPKMPRPPFDPGPVMKAFDLLERRIDEVLSIGVQRLNSLSNPIKQLVSTIPDRVDLSRSARERIGERLATLAAKQRTLEKTIRQHPRLDRAPLEALADALGRVRAWLARVDAAAERDRNPRVGPEFPDLVPKPAAWTVSPHSRVLPDRFLVVAVSNGRVRHVAAGKPLDPALKLGLDPDPARADAERVTIDADGELHVGDSIRWMADYDEALKKGMAISVELSPEDAREGFDRVYVIGVKDATAANGQRLIESLLEDHHYGPNGLGFLPAGTATNNTEQAAAGFASVDDPEQAYDLERKGPIFDHNPARPMDASDALRFARAVGIQPAAVDRIANAGSRDVSEALLVNEALWPATVGAYLEDFFGALVDPDGVRRVRSFFVSNVVPRGIAPVLRVGDQPYGLLATMAFSRYKPATGTILPAPPQDGAADAEQKRAARFNLLFPEVLAIAQNDWSRIRESKVKHAHSPGITDAQQHFLDMLGQDPTSASWGYRYAMNVAQRQPPPIAGNPGFDFLYPRTAPGTIATAALQGPVALIDRFATVFRAAGAIPANVPPVDPTTGLVSGAFAPALDAVRGSGAYKVRYLATPRRFTGIVVDDRTSTWIPQLLAASATSLADEARQGNLRSRCLLYVLLRYAVLASQRDAARDILLADGLDEATWTATGSDAHFLLVDLFGPSAMTKWSWLFQPLRAADARAGAELPAGQNTLRAHLEASDDASLARYLASRGANQLFQTSPRRAAHTAAVEQLTRHAGALSAMATLTPGRLSQLVQEHLDVCSHRLDAWRLGLAHQRLAELRGRNPNGIYLGAFGWVEDLRPDAPLQPAAAVPAALQRRGETIFEAASNEGFVHTPSLSHAVTAAILRSGYLSEAARRDLDNRMAVNLSSRRVRAALDLIEGIGAGSTLSSLLGYRIERMLHEAFESQQVTLDDLIYKLRRAFPALAPVDPDAISSTQAERAVIDGVALLGAVRASLEAAGRTIGEGGTVLETLRANGHYTGHPWGVLQQDGSAILPATSDSARLDGFLRAIDHAADALDAVGDVALAEAVYQLSRGNHVRASAVLAALAEGKPLPRPEIVATPRTGTMLTHRLFLIVPRLDGTLLSRSAVADRAERDANRQAAAPASWAAIPMTPRACAEPSLNRWLGTALGDPANIVARVVERETGDEVAIVSARDLGLQPLDVLALVGPGVDAAGGELAARILSVAVPANLDPKAPPALRKVTLEPGAWSVNRISFFEVAPLCQAVHDLLAKARPATATDFLDEAAKGSGPQPIADRTELEARARGALAELEAAGALLADLLSNGGVSDASALDDSKAFLASNAGVFRRADGNVDAAAVIARRSDFARWLLAASSFGIPGALPPSHYSEDAAFARSLLERAEGAFAEVAARRTRAKPAIDAAGSADALVKALRMVLNEDAAILPPFVLRNGDAVKSALAADLLRDAGPQPVDRWLHGVAAVRDRTGFLRQALLMTDLFGMARPVRGVAQLPFSAGDRWLATELPGGAASDTPKLSLVMLGSDALGTDGRPSVALLADEWNEVIPSASETTGIALHADQPDATPPQAMLLVVPPAAPPANGSGRWSLEDLVRTLDETFDLARDRLVEPEHLADEVYAQVLPAIAGELIPDAVRDRGAPLGDRVPLDFGAAGQGVG